jgi:hypothetical protein
LTKYSGVKFRVISENGGTGPDAAKAKQLLDYVTTDGKTLFPFFHLIQMLKIVNLFFIFNFMFFSYLDTNYVFV